MRGDGDNYHESKEKEKDDKEKDGRSNIQDDGRGIGGSLSIHRGSTLEQAEEKLKELKHVHSTKTAEVKDRIQTHLDQGPVGSFHAERRRRHLQEDDGDPTTITSLDPSKQRALLKRKRLEDKRTKAKLTRLETKRYQAAMDAADAEMVLHTQDAGFLQVEDEMERTSDMTQQQLKGMVDEQTARNIFNLTLNEYGPYKAIYDRSGRQSILLGKGSGHVAIMDNHTLALQTEFQLRERVRDATFLHNTSLFAVAQNQYVYIYDDVGTEIHEMKDHRDISRLEFLPHHWLLATIGKTGWLKYHDTSTGELVSQHRTKLGPCNTMTQNKHNAILHCGHNNGVVTLWSPASNEYLVKMQCHKGSPIQSIAIDKTGHRMVTAGADSKLKIWDLRMYKETHSYYYRGRPPLADGLDISQTGILGIATGCHARFYSQDALKYKVKGKDPYYMTHTVHGGNGPIESLKFRPFEDVCGLGLKNGFSSIVIPGSGEPTLDSMEYGTNPYQDKKQRQEGEVRALLDKLSPDMIALDPDVIGTIEESSDYTRLKRKEQMEEEANAKKEDEKPKKEKQRKRGRNKIKAKLARKQKNIVDENKIKLLEDLDRQKKDKEQAKKNSEEENEAKVADAPTALKRFFK